MKRLKKLENEERTMVFYESPHRIFRLIDQLIDVFGGHRKASLSRELTKIHEENVRGSLDELAASLKDVQPRGEYVLVVAGKSSEKY